MRLESNPILLDVCFTTIHGDLIVIYKGFVPSELYLMEDEWTDISVQIEITHFNLFFTVKVKRCNLTVFSESILDPVFLVLVLVLPCVCNRHWRK